jgi:hypothetical protein
MLGKRNNIFEVILTHNLILDKVVPKIVIHSERIVFAVHKNKWINMSTRVKLLEN